jgi:hypothetical protein
MERVGFSEAKPGKPFTLAVWRREESVAVLSVYEHTDGRQIQLVLSNVPAFVRKYSEQPIPDVVVGWDTRMRGLLLAILAAPLLVSCPSDPTRSNDDIPPKLAGMNAPMRGIG